MEALAAVRSSDIPNLVKGLPSRQVDTLMKYIYRGMASPELYNSAILLAWHEKVSSKAEYGIPYFNSSDFLPLHRP